MTTNKQNELKGKNKRKRFAEFGHVTIKLMIDVDVHENTGIPYISLFDVLICIIIPSSFFSFFFLSSLFELKWLFVPESDLI